jgi:alpha-L-rhamnosidase
MTPDKTSSSVSVARLRTEYQENPLGIDVLQPRLSWQLVSDRRGAMQSAYQLCVADQTGEIWDTGQITSSQSTYVAYAGPALRSGQHCTWRVRVWDDAGNASDWSESAWWEMGLLDPSDWRAKWITPGWPESTSSPQPCPMLRTEFRVDGAVRSARLYISSLGLYLARLNGHTISDWQFTPGWTSYRHRLQYQTHDVTTLLINDANALGVTLGDGWYRGYLGWKAQRNIYGEQLALLCQLHVVYVDGHEQWVNSDEGWRAATGPIRQSDIYMGEVYDARLERPGWDRAGYPDDAWSPVHTCPPPSGSLVAQPGPPVRRMDEVRPIALLHSSSGETIVDFGQNMVGRVRLRVQGPAGSAITLRHAEILDAAGNLYTHNLRSATQTDRCILRGGDEEVYEPHFTFHGFRYVAVEGWPGALDLEDLTGVVLHSDMEATGSFECSHPFVNQLQHNIVWGQKGNFLDVPTDCPQRDERMGWTGDAQVFMRTAVFNFNVGGFFAKWLRDLSADQWPDGAVPHVVPDVLATGTDRHAGATGWADAATICPWTLYQCYGDTRVLEEQYASMTAWIEYMRHTGETEYLFGSGEHFGDWLALDQPADGALIGATDLELIGTAFYACSTDIVARAARVLGKASDARKYTALHRKIVQAFRREFLTPGGRLASNTQTAYVLALQFDLLPEKQRPEAACRLVADIERRGHHLSTGFLGTPYLCHVLSRFGYLDVAYDLLLQEHYPAWLYPVTHGATTIWERWDGRKPDGSFQDPRMNSFNHYAYGSIGDWLYEVVAGLNVDPEQPGYRHAIIRPRPGGGLTHARAALETLFGRYAVAWRMKADEMQVDVQVPANGSADVYLPAAQLDQVTESGVPLADASGCRNARQETGDVVVEIGAGDYRFSFAPVSTA